MAITSPARGLRADAATVVAWLDRLDQSAAQGSHPDQRQSNRFPYRPGPLTLQVLRGDEFSDSYVIACRNVSREGLGFLAGQFLYPGARCRVALPSPYGCDQTVSGRVARCRYLMGSAVLHEVGLTFERPVDVTLLAPHGRLLHVLVVDDSEVTHELVRRLLRRRHVDLACATSSEDAVRLGARGEFDLILVDLESASFNGLDVVRRMRRRGYVGPIIGLTAQAGDERREECAAAGCTGYLTKPITREELLDLVGGLLDQPVVSTLADDEDMAPLIDHFVAGLRDKVSQLAVAHNLRDTATLQNIVRRLRAEAGSYGFEIISRRAAYVEALLSVGEVGSRVGKALRRLMHVCLKARPATSPPDAAVLPLGRLTCDERASLSRDRQPLE